MNAALLRMFEECAAAFVQTNAIANDVLEPYIQFIEARRPTPALIERINNMVSSPDGEICFDAEDLSKRNRAAFGCIQSRLNVSIGREDEIVGT